MKDAADSLREAMNQRKSQSTPDIFHAWILQMLANHKEIQYQTVPSEDDSFQARRRFYLLHYLQPILVEEFAKDLGVKKSTIKPRLIAAQAITLLEAFDFNFTAKQRTIFVADSMSFLESGIQTLQQKS